VQLLVDDVHVNESGKTISEPVDPLPDVPVMFVGVDGVRIDSPVREGSLCWVAFSQGSITGLKSGATGELDGRRHHLNDAVAIMGLSFAPVAARPLIFFDDDIRIGSESATQRALLGDAFVSALQTMVTSIAAAVGGIPTGGSAAAAGITTALNTFISAAATYKSQIVKVQ
jgi:hypothetical protein